METIGNLDLVPAQRRVGGSGASFLMSPFTHVSPDRPSRFSDGAYGVLHAGSAFDVALFETIFHHGRFMSATHEAPGWTSRFREIKLRVKADLHDLRGSDSRFAAALAPNSYRDSQVVGRTLWSADSNGIVYPSQRAPEGDCVGLFYPDLASHPRQGRPLDYHWNGEFVDLYRDGASGNVYRVAV